MERDQFSVYRLVSMFVIAAETFLSTTIISYFRDLYLDDWICMYFMDVVFLLVFVFEIEYERLHRRLADNSQTSFRWIAIGYTICSVMLIGFSFLPAFYRPVMLIPILMCAFSNDGIALHVGLFFVLQLCMSTKVLPYEMIGYLLLVLTTSVFCKTIQEKKYRTFAAVLMFFQPVLIMVLAYYWTYHQVFAGIYLYSAIHGAVSAVIFWWFYDHLHREVEHYVEHQYELLIRENYPRVRELRNFAPEEYQHALWVSTLAGKCAAHIGLNSDLCAAAGFYYHMGLWLSAPHIENGVKKAKQLCFPEELQQILAEYNGINQLPSSKESALVHMVDALVIKVEESAGLIEKSKWNHDLVVYQTLNDMSASGLYDQSGLSINEYLKVRDFLTKEVF